MSLPELKIEEARIQDGTINNPTDFWQLVMDTGYIMEGEKTAILNANSCTG